MIVISKVIENIFARTIFPRDHHCLNTIENTEELGKVVYSEVSMEYENVVVQTLYVTKH